MQQKFKRSSSDERGSWGNGLYYETNESRLNKINTRHKLFTIAFSRFAGVTIFPIYFCTVQLKRNY